MLLLAHIFKKRSRGEREEVEIRLFNQDGSDYEGAGPGGGETTAAFAMAANQNPIPDNSGIGHELPLTVFSQQGDVEVDDNHLVMPQGAYLVQFKTHWTNFGAPSSGHLNVRVYHVDLSNSFTEALFIDQMAADGIEPDIERQRVLITPDDGYFFVQVDQNITADQEATPAMQGWLTIVKL